MQNSNPAEVTNTFDLDDIKRGVQLAKKINNVPCVERKLPSQMTQEELMGKYVDLKLLQDFFKNHYDVSVFEKKNEEVLKTMAT